MKTIYFIFSFGLVVLFFSCNNKNSNPNQSIVNAQKVKSNSKVAVHSNKSIDLKIEGMVCEMGCGSSIRKALKETNAVERCSFDFKDGRAINTAKISFDSTIISKDKIISVISELNDKQFKVIL